jgi:hypothetical protein
VSGPDLFVAPQGHNPQTVWVQTATGMQETTMPRPAAQFLAGYGAPTDALGVDGSVYLDVVAGSFFGPKAGGVWPRTPIGRLVSAPKE